MKQIVSEDSPVRVSSKKARFSRLSVRSGGSDSRDLDFAKSQDGSPPTTFYPRATTTSTGRRRQVGFSA